MRSGWLSEVSASSWCDFPVCVWDTFVHGTHCLNSKERIVQGTTFGSTSVGDTSSWPYNPILCIIELVDHFALQSYKGETKGQNRHKDPTLRGVALLHYSDTAICSVFFKKRLVSNSQHRWESIFDYESLPEFAVKTINVSETIKGTSNEPIYKTKSKNPTRCHVPLRCLR